ncbi:hypothetical protein DXG01_002620 [Tephrocybe rancida]|nr:hypothetical protein DXG01_002620 [Tephrocybe rancida]
MKSLGPMPLKIPHYVPIFLWKFWLSPTGPNDLPRDPRLHVYDVYDNDLSEIINPPDTTRPVFQDLATETSSRLLQSAEVAFRALEFEAEETLSGLIDRTFCSGDLDKSTSFGFDQSRLTNLCRYLVFLRFRNSAKYREIVQSFQEHREIGTQNCVLSTYELFVEHRRVSFLREIVAFLENVPLDGRDRLLETAGLSTAMNAYCWSLSGADISIGIAANDQEFILPDSCCGTLNEGFDEDPECCDLFFPILPSFALYILGNVNKRTHPCFTVANTRVEVGVESASDVHLRNSMILQTYPHYLYFSALRPVALSVSSYDEFRWIQEHQDYSRLKQRCRQKFLQETVTKTLVVKGSVILTDLTDEVVHIGTCAAGHGAFADVWKAVWNDPVEKRSRHVALKVLRTVMVKNVKENLMKRLQSEVEAWHRLCHRNISQLCGVVQFQNSIGMVSPWLGLLTQIASGVAYLHSATPVVVHGDLKGGNILIDEHGCPIITDFGLSKVKEDLSDSIQIASSFFAGSTRWMAPELIRALIEDDGPAPPITRESDVYAFGSVVTGGLPYPHRMNDHAVTVDILRGVKPSRGSHCIIRLKDEDAFWKTLDNCWNEAPYLRPTMKDLRAQKYLDSSIMEALVTAPGNIAVVSKVPIPEPAADEIRIKVRAVSLNPVDALYTASPPAPDDPGRVVGSDFSGVVDKVGENVKQWKVGDRVTGFVQGATAENRRPGGFAEYAILEADLAIRIPSDVSFEEASTVPLCALTAAQMLFITLGLKAPFNNPAKVTHELKDTSPAILIYSASTSVGIFAIELASLARTSEGKPYRIFATASPKHHEKLLKKGVTAVFDYRDSDWPAKVHQNSGGIVAALDCIAEGDSTAKISHSFGDAGGPIATVRGEAWSRTGFKEGVTGIYTTVWVGLGHDLYYRGTLYFICTPRPLAHSDCSLTGKKYPASKDWRAFTVEFYKYLSAHPNKYPIKHVTPRIMPDGLYGIVPFAFPLLGDNLVIDRKFEGSEGSPEHLKPISAEKLVFPLKS